MSMDTMFAGSLYITVQNALLPEGSKPITMPWPWPDPGKAPDVTAEERANAQAFLDANSAFGQIRNN